MKRCGLVVVSAICVLLISAVGHAESRIPVQCWNDRCQQSTNVADAIHAGVLTSHFAQVTADDKRDYDKIDNYVLDRSVVRKLNRAVLSIKSACMSVKSGAEKLPRWRTDSENYWT